MHFWDRKNWIETNISTVCCCRCRKIYRGRHQTIWNLFSCSSSVFCVFISLLRLPLTPCTITNLPCQIECYIYAVTWATHYSWRWETLDLRCDSSLFAKSFHYIFFGDRQVQVNGIIVIIKCIMCMRRIHISHKNVCQENVIIEELKVNREISSRLTMIWWWRPFRLNIFSKYVHFTTLKISRHSFWDVMLRSFLSKSE